MAAAERAVSQQAGAAASGDAWDGGERGWDVYFALILAGMLVLIQVTGSASEQARLVATAALLAMVPWYLVAGRRALYAAGQPPWLGPAYLAGLIALLAVAQACTGSDTLILLGLGAAVLHGGELPAGHRRSRDHECRAARRRARSRRRQRLWGRCRPGRRCRGARDRILHRVRHLDHQDHRPERGAGRADRSSWSGPVPSSPTPTSRRGSSPNAPGWPATSMTPSLRASPAL